MNREDYVSLEVAKILKEKGFDYATLYYYEKNGKLGMMNLDAQSQMRKHGYMNDIYPRPTLYEAQKWLWNNHKLLVVAFLKAPFGQPCEFIYCIQDAKNTLDDYGTIVSDESYESIQIALNAGILEALKLI